MRGLDRGQREREREVDEKKMERGKSESTKNRGRLQ
jgi:hypothetical protein